MPIRRFGYTIYKLTGGRASRAAYTLARIATRDPRAVRRAIVDEVKAMPTTATLVGGQIITNVHLPTECAGRPCAVHHPSEHHMSGWTQRFRPDRLMIERVCEHRIGHPDPDHMAWLDERVMRGELTPDFVWGEGAHGCDGCCTPPEARA